MPLRAVITVVHVEDVAREDSSWLCGVADRVSDTSSGAIRLTIPDYFTLISEAMRPAMVHV